MLACLSPADNNYDETLSTLRYANRAKNICNKPHVNEDPKDAMLRKYQEEIEKLKSMLTTPKMSAVGEILHLCLKKPCIYFYLKVTFIISNLTFLGISICIQYLTY